MLEFRTTGFNGYAVKFSPFFDSRFAVAASANFGLVGNARLYVLGLSAQGIAQERCYDTNDSLYDTAWSEINESQLVAACGDGSVKLYDINSASIHPVTSWQEHRREVYSVSWNLVTKDSFASSSWDGTIKVWSPVRPASILTLPTHSCTYSTAFSPHSPSIISSVTADSHLRIFDLRTPASATNHLVQLIPVHGSAPQPGSTLPNPNRQIHPPNEILTHDWNKYRSSVVACAGVDRIIRVFDIRNPSGPAAMLEGHEYAVRKLAWSPHLSDVLISGSYDMTARVWTDGTASGVQAIGHPMGAARQIGRLDAHTEFVTGVDWCLFGTEGWAATCAWDERVLIFDVRDIMGR